jgi:hypothetical protein
MKIIKKFEDYKVKNNFGYTIYPDFFEEGGELFDYLNLKGTQDTYDFPHSDPNYWEKVSKINKKRKKDRKHKYKEILSYINDFIKLPENKNFCNGRFTEFATPSTIIDFDFVIAGTDKLGEHKIETLKLSTRFGTYELNQKDFEDLVRYTSDPELYLDTKKYNL